VVDFFPVSLSLKEKAATPPLTAVHKIWYSYATGRSEIISLICDKSVTTQNLPFLSYWCRKKRLQMHF
jgi:hypothetical protein